MFRELDENGDIKAGTFVYEKKSVGLNVATQIQEWIRENPEDLSAGIDWKQELSDFNQGRLTAQIRDIAFLCSEVTAVSQSLKFTGPDKDRIVHVEFSVRTTYGDEVVGVKVNA